MKLVTPGDSAPASVNRYLLPHEQQVITVRRHPAVLLGPTAIVLGSLIAAGILSNTSFVTSGAMLAIIWWLWLLVLVWFVWKVAEWSVDYFVITSARLLGRLLGYGTFVMESAGQDQALSKIDFIPYPEQLYLEVVGLIFPDK